MSFESAWFTAGDASGPPGVMVIAELGVNHDGDDALAVRLVDAAADLAVGHSINGCVGKAIDIQICRTGKNRALDLFGRSGSMIL